MTPRPSEPRSVRILASTGTGATVIALAFTVHPIQAAGWVFWVVVGAGATVVIAGCSPLMHGVLAGGRRDAPSRRRRAAAECRRVQEALDVFAADRLRLRPRAGRFTSSLDRTERWREETVTRYRDELRSWVTQVFDEAVEFGAVSSSARPLVDAPGATQIAALRDLFRDAADQLERTVA